MKNQYFRLQDVGVFTLYGWKSLANIRRWQCHQKNELSFPVFSLMCPACFIIFFLVTFRVLYRLDGIISIPDSIGFLISKFSETKFIFIHVRSEREKCVSISLL